MDGDIVGLILSGAYVMGSIPWIVLLPIAVTFAHTAEESLGEIWAYLGVPAAGYFAFQLFVLGLGVAACFNFMALIAFVIIRVLDVTVTHILAGAPGQITAVLLLIDAAVLLAIGVQ